MSRKSWGDPACQRFGEIAVARGYITVEQLREALENQRELKSLGLTEKIGGILTKKGWLGERALQEILLELETKQRRIGNFDVYEKIGQGAMGVVFRARQVSLDRIVALKILAPKYADNREFTERFIREARSAGQFSHENIVSALDVGYAAPYYYFAMEYVDGRSLRERLEKEGPLPEAEALLYTLHVARGLAHALRKKIIHRDVKPDNIMIVGGKTAKLLDLGLACAVGADSDEESDSEEKREKGKRITQLGKALGTPHYISPEAARGQEDLDCRADIYSLGCTLFHLLTGTTPFQASSGREVMACHITGQVPEVRSRRPELSAQTAAVVTRMTAKDREQRYQTPLELAEDLEALLKQQPLVHAQEERGRKGRKANPTTGPQRPVTGRATTGPRIAVGPRSTTGPLAPVGVERLEGPVKPLGRGSSSQATGLITAGSLVALGVLGLLVWGGGSRPAARKEGLKPAENPGPAPSGAPGGNSNLTVLGGDRPAQVQPAAPQVDREGQARAALAAFRARQQAAPAALGALWTEGEALAAQARGTGLEAEALAALTQVREAWLKRLEPLLESAAVAAEGAAARGDFKAAQAALADEVVPGELRAADWQARLRSRREVLVRLAESRAAALLDEGRKAAQPGDAEGLRLALEQARAAEELPSPLAAQAAGERKGYEQKLAGLQAAQARAEAERKEQAAHQWVELHKKLGSLVREFRLKAALELVEGQLNDKRAPLDREWLKREREDLRGIQALQAQAIEALLKRKGEQVTLRNGGLPLKGKLAGADERGGVALILPGGASTSVSPEQLTLQDIELYAPLPEGGAEAALARRTRSYLHLLCGEHGKARQQLEQARQADPKLELGSYALRLDLAQAGLEEFKARQAWEGAEACFARRDWEGARKAFEAFEQLHGKSKTFALQGGLLNERKEKLRQILNPVEPGLLGTYCSGAEFEPSGILLSRVDAQIDFQWGNASPDPKIPGDGFFIRWEGFLRTAKAGKYTFATVADDGTKLWLDGKQVITTGWNIHPSQRHAGEIVLSEGQHALRLDYYEGGGGACVKFLWALEGGFREVLVPPEVLSHATRPGGKPAAPAAAPEALAGLESKGAHVFLSDLPETEVKVGFGKFGKKGELGYDQQRIKVGGKEYPHAISMHPPSNEYSHVAYLIEGKAKTFKAAYAINDTGKSDNTIIFKVLGDGKLLWKSEPYRKNLGPQLCQVDLGGVQKLELQIDCPGSYGFAHAVWLEPRLEQ